MTPIKMDSALRAKLLADLKSGKILFLNWKKKSVMGAAIRFVEWVKYNLKMKKAWEVDKSHSSVLIGIFTPQGKVINRLIHLEALSRGITPNSLTWSLDQKDVEYVDIYELETFNNVEKSKIIEAVDKAYGLAWKSVNTPYGFTTIASILFSTVLISTIGYDNTLKLGKKTGVSKWLEDKLEKNIICSQFNTMIANIYSKAMNGENFIDTKKTPWVDPEAFESLTDKLIFKCRVSNNV